MKIINIKNAKMIKIMKIQLNKTRFYIDYIFLNTCLKNNSLKIIS